MEVDEFLNIAVKQEEDLEKKTPGRPKKEEIDEELFVVIDGEELRPKNRVRMKENFNKLKQDQLLEILEITKKGELKVQCVYNGVREILTTAQVYYQ